MSDNKPEFCPDCDGITRRDFLKAVGGVTVAAAAGVPVFATARPAAAAPKPGSQESLVTHLYGTLSPEQKSAVCFDWGHKKRLQVDNNWFIVPQTIGEFYKPEQQALISDIFKSAHSEEWIAKRLQQMKDDAGAFDKYCIAIFGEPGSGKFELVMTGRHMTMRVDGDSNAGVALGGPHFYGHAVAGNEKPDHPGNVYWYQALRANDVYKALDGKQREKALLLGPIPADNPSVLITGRREGLPVADMTKDQQDLVGKVLGDLLAPMNRADAGEARKYIDANGGVKSLSMSFYKQQDLGDDGVWDVWRLDGPTMSWYFRGAPHVHTWVWIGEKPLTTAPPNSRAA